jgi:hypothetical protein
MVSPLEANKFLNFVERIVDCSGQEVVSRFNVTNGGGFSAGTKRVMFITRKGNSPPLQQVLTEMKLKKDLAKKIKLAERNRQVEAIEEEARKLIAADVEPSITPVNIKKEIRSLLGRYS